MRKHLRYHLWRLARLVRSRLARQFAMPDQETVDSWPW